MQGIVFGALVPHPPAIVPGLGGPMAESLVATVDAMKLLSRELASSRPDCLLWVSTHGPYYYSAMGVLAAGYSWGSLPYPDRPALELRFPNDPALAQAVEKESSAAGIPVKPLGDLSHELDHGITVPLYYLRETVDMLPLVVLSVSGLPLGVHHQFGQALQRAVQGMDRRVAVLASGELSHRPGPRSDEVDRTLLEALSQRDAARLLGADAALLEGTGACGLRPLVVLLGALQGLPWQPRVLSRERSGGAGYAVVACPVQEKVHPLVELACKTVEGALTDGSLPYPAELTPEMQGKAGVFVSIKRRGMLRGCIGTIEPSRENVAEEVIFNALSSAFRDPRFPPVDRSEIPGLTFSVDILTPADAVENPDQLDPRRYGVIVESLESSWKRGLLLPDLEGVDTVEAQIEICKQKAGILPGEPVRLLRFEVKRYR